MLQRGLSKIHCPDTVIRTQCSFGKTSNSIVWFPLHSLETRADNLHQGEGGVVRRDPGEVVLQHGQGAGQRYVTATAE